MGSLDGIHKIELLNNPEAEFLSYDQVKCQLSQTIWCHTPITQHVPRYLCGLYWAIWWTWLLSMLLNILISTWDYYPLQVVFTTVPIGSVIQALYSSPDTADQMHYLERLFSANAEHAWCTDGILGRYNDISCGKDILYVWNSGALRKSNVALQLSIDGTQ